jgi:hypothetical protein
VSSGQQLIKDRGQGIQIDARIGARTVNLLRSHVGHGAHRKVTLGAPRAMDKCVRYVRDAQVSQLGPPLTVQEHVSGSEVVVDDAHLVQIAYRVTYGQDERGRALQAHLFPAIRPIREGKTGDIFENDVMIASISERRFGTHNVGMAKPLQSPAFAYKATNGLIVFGQGRDQFLEDDLLRKQLVVSEISEPKPSVREELLDSVSSFFQQGALGQGHGLVVSPGS